MKHPLSSKCLNDNLRTTAYYTVMCLEMKMAPEAVVYSEMYISIIKLMKV